MPPMCHPFSQHFRCGLTSTVRIRPFRATIYPRTQYGAPQIVHGRRYKSKETGENKSGHIEAGPNEGILFLDNVFPLKLSAIFGLYSEKFLLRVMQHLRSPEIVAASPEQVAERAFPTTLPTPIKVTEVLPRVKEGGAFVKFTHDPAQDIKGIEKAAKKYLKDNPIKPWFNPIRRIKTSLVRGRPWVEDLHRAPSQKIRVEFVPVVPGSPAEELSEETLYSLFRTYGKLADIVPQPTDSKDLPKYAYLKYDRVRHAIRAKNCMHGFVVPASEGGGQSGTMVKIFYEQKRKAHYIWNWLVNHPRLVVPILLALFGTITVSVFDPYVEKNSSRRFSTDKT